MATTSIAAASLFLMTQGAFVSTDTVPYLELDTVPYVSVNGGSQVESINRMEYACEAFGQEIANVLTHCPEVEAIKTEASSEFGFFAVN